MGDSDADQQRLSILTHLVLQALEEIACESAVAKPPESMMSSVCHTIQDARGEKSSQTEEMSPGTGLDREWSLLAACISGKDESKGVLASSWLFSLFVAIADMELLEGHQSPSPFFALLPALTENSGKLCVEPLEGLGYRGIY